MTDRCGTRPHQNLVQDTTLNPLGADMPRRVKLEAVDSVDEILNGYDSEADCWNFSFQSDFWKAVSVAHERGVRGQGRRVAIIDSGCNLTIPRLRAQVDHVFDDFIPRDFDATAKHGTAVALLISTVAPESRFDVYRVANDEGYVDLLALVDAITAASESDADVINLSLGIANPLGETPTNPAAEPYDPAELLRAMQRENSDCELCDAAIAAHRAGKLVFAAVGNSVIDVYCPARRDEVVAVGFQRTERIEHLAFSLPVRSESPHADLFVGEMPGVLGSSFACPLYAGVGALGVSQDELVDYVATFSKSASPKMQHARLAEQFGGAHRAPSELFDAVEQAYVNALRALPHVHCSLQQRWRPDKLLQDPCQCTTCGFFAKDVYVKAARWLFETARHEEGAELCEAARQFAPWDAEASALLGQSCETRGLRAEAFRNYAMTLKLRPDYRLDASQLIAHVSRAASVPSDLEASLRRNVEAAIRDGNRVEASELLSQLGMITRESGNFEQALEYSRQRVDQARATGDVDDLAESLIQLACVQEDCGLHQDALASYDQAAAGVERWGREGQLQLEYATARLLLRLKDVDTGLPLMDAVIKARLHRGEAQDALVSAGCAAMLLAAIDRRVAVDWAQYWHPLCEGTPDLEPEFRRILLLSRALV